MCKIYATYSVQKPAGVIALTESIERNPFNGRLNKTLK